MSAKELLEAILERREGMAIIGPWAEVCSDAAKLRTENAKLREALEAVECVEYTSDGQGEWCPWCKEGWWTHKPDCQRQLALGLKP